MADVTDEGVHSLTGVSEEVEEGHDVFFAFSEELFDDALLEEDD